MTVLKLSCGDWRAGVLPAEGANLAWLFHQGDDVLRSRESAICAGEELPLYGSPIIFPANRTKDGAFTFRGQKYQLPINEPTHCNHLHGTIMKRMFQVLRADERQVVCRYKSKPEDYPFPFLLTVSFTLSERGLIQRYALKNTGKDEFPAVFGLHTTFPIPDFLCIPSSYRLERDERFLPTGAALPLTPQEACWAAGASYQGEQLSGYYFSNGHTVQVGKYVYRVSKLFDHWTLYGGRNRDFICIEPQAGQVNGLNCPGRHLVVPKDGTLIFTTMISKKE